MRLSHLLNPLRWKFGPRTTATMLTWAVLPVTVAGFVVWRSFRSAAAAAGLPPEQVASIGREMLTGGLWVTVPLTVVAAFASALFAYLVVKPVWRLQQSIERMARGELSQLAVPTTSDDEVGQITRAYNSMASRLTEMVQTMAETAAALDTAAGRLDASTRESRQATATSIRQIEAVQATAAEEAAQATTGARAIRELEEAASQVAIGASAQAHEVENAAETVKQMAAAIEQVASGAGVVATAAHNTRRAAEDGGDAVQLSADGMDQVRARVLDAAAKLRDLSQSLRQVDEILELITEIAGQTDLLALNAAIEAARVGEHGKGFAVVAGEVRRLAERVRTAAGEIAGRVDTLRHGANAVVETMEMGTRDVEQGVILSRRAAEALEGILTAVAETQSQVDSISAASEEIAAASSQVVNVTVQLSAIAEENAATAEEMLSSAQSVTELIAGVEQDAKHNQAATAAMAASAAQVSSAVDEMVELAGNVTQVAGALRKQVEFFKLS